MFRSADRWSYTRKARAPLTQVHLAGIFKQDDRPFTYAAMTPILAPRAIACAIKGPARFVGP
ncbi:hypothetical protein RLO149_c023150 [Roseobacter litoralis Och 149]|uniref:Uncharacterized protein n=1 Tax=Roseobacter litoralis (strain ATCC 49566 / DSM 6996 / JCM 21268 / NBRC 15278 / OCh 149) TaxID=391595 RepID=F7ZAT9_ROSLO|nr:hypothetical protein RLO149_c023150 [Roseobacter litoralis Och 149]